MKNSKIGKKGVSVPVRQGTKRPVLTLRERSIIEIRYTKDKWTLQKIADEVGKNKSTISREVSGKERSGKNKYNADVANRAACERIEKRGNTSKLDDSEMLKLYVVTKLKLRWSPEQISGRLEKDYPNDTSMRISYEAIYQFVYGQFLRDGNGKLKDGCEDLRQYLPRRHKRRATKGCRKAQKLERAASLPSIESRPPVVDERSRIGDWEDDLVVSREGNAQVKSVNERKSGIHFFRKTTGRTAIAGDEQVVACFQSIPPEYRRTLTRDRGSENKAHESLNKSLAIDIYFAHPYCSYERGSNENGNGLLRRFFPKGTNWDMISEEDLSHAEYLINTRPRKRLNWMTPSEYFYQETGVALFV